MELSPRLAAVASLVDRGCVVADIGCDHGLLVAYLLRNGWTKVVATDRSEISLNKTRKRAEQLGLEGLVLRVGDGFSCLKRDDEVGCAVISGLGGRAMGDIIGAGTSVLQSPASLVLQPQNAIGEVRKCLSASGYRVADELIRQEGGRFYRILKAVPGVEEAPADLFEEEFGRYLVENRPPELRALLQFHLRLTEQQIEAIEPKPTQRTIRKLRELQNFGQRCREVLAWL